MSTLCELGNAMPDVLDSIAIHNETSTSLEAVRHAACTGAREVLESPPCALFHPSAMQTSNWLYGVQSGCMFEDVPYKRVDMDTFRSVPCDRVVGAATIDLCKGHSRPAVIYAGKAADGGTALRIEVFDAPLAAMEVELYHRQRAASAFEQKWMTPNIADEHHGVRCEMGDCIRRCGFQKMPMQLHGHYLYITRPGALPLLRLRLPSNAQERDAVRAMLEQLPMPKGGASTLKAVLEALPPQCAVDVQTVFLQAPVAEKAPPEEEKSCACVMQNSVLGPLAVLVLKHMKNDDYYNTQTEYANDVVQNDDAFDAEEEASESLDIAVGEAGESRSPKQVALDADGEGPKEAQKHDAVFQTWIETEEEARQAELTEQSSARLAYCTSKCLMHLAAATRRVCDLKLIARSSCHLQMARSLTATFFGAADAALLMRMLSGSHRADLESLESIAAFLARSGSARHAVLVLCKASDGTLSDCRLFSKQGGWTVSHDSVTRYLLFPWTVPLVVDGDLLQEAKVAGVVREQLSVSKEARQAAEVEPVASQLPPNVQSMLSSIDSSLRSVSELVSRVGAVETALSAVREAPRAVDAVRQAARAESDVTRGFKRIHELLETQDVSEAEASR